MAIEQVLEAYGSKIVGSHVEVNDRHVIQNPSGTAMTDREKLQFTGNAVSVTDDSTNGKTIVDITAVSDANYVHTDNNYTSTDKGKVDALGTASAKDFTTSVTQNSSDLVTSGAVFNAIDNLPEPMVFKGTLGTGGTITSLPTASSSNKGFTYKVITAGTYASQSAKVGDVFTSNATEWVLIPSGDETFTDTWRGIQVDGTDLLGNSITTGKVNFKSGSNVTVTGSGNDITINATDTTYSDATQSVHGLMSTTDKTKLDGIGAVWMLPHTKVPRMRPS